MRATLAAVATLAAYLLDAFTPKVSISLSTTTGGDAQVFYAAQGEVYTQDRSVSFSVAADGAWHAYEVPLPRGANPVKLRIDPVPGTRNAAIRLVTLGTMDSRLTLQGESLARSLQTTNSLEMIRGQEPELRFRSQGFDPYLDLSFSGAGRTTTAWPTIAAAAVARGLGGGLAWLVLEWLVLSGLSRLRRAIRLDSARQRLQAVARALREGRARASTTLYASLFWALVASFIVLGLCIAFTQPAFSGPDETMHWEVGHIRAERFLGDRDCVRTLPFGHSYRGAKNLVPYGSLSSLQLPCIVGMKIYGDLLTYPGIILSKLVLPHQQQSAVRQLQGLLVSRLIQGLIFALALSRVGWLALQSSRPGVLLLVGLSNAPVFAQQTFSVTADGSQLCFAVSLFSALLLWERWTRLDLVLLLLFGWSAAGKPFLAPCVVPSLFGGFWYAQIRCGRSVGEILREIPPTLAFARRRLHGAALWAGILITVMFVGFAFLAHLSGTTRSIFVADVDAKAQLLVLRSDPFRTVRITFRDTLPWINSLDRFASPLGWLDTNLSHASINAFRELMAVTLGLELLLLVLHRVVIARPYATQMQTSLRRLLAPLAVGTLAATGSVVTLVTVLYLVWTPVGMNGVQGLQARYFLPPLIVLIGVGCAAIDVLLAAPHASSRSPVGERTALDYVLKVSGPILIAALAVPYVVSVFIDLNQRYL